MTTSVVYKDENVFTLNAKQHVKDSHWELGNSNSPLLKIPTCIQSHFTGIAIKSIKLSLTEAVGACKEHYVIELSKHTVDVVITSHNAFDNLLNKIKYPDTVKAINATVADMSECITEDYISAVKAFILGTFKHYGDTCVFQAEFDKDEWYLSFHDAKHRAHAEIQIYTKPVVAALFKQNKEFILI